MIHTGPTCFDILFRLRLNGRISLSSCLKVFKYVDVRSKMQHVLFSAAVRHLKQIAKTIKRLSHQVTYNNVIPDKLLDYYQNEMLLIMK